MSINDVKINYALNAGEVSARFEARQDKATDKYLSSMRLCSNWLPVTVGGAKRRPGWHFVAKTKFSGQANSKVILYPFQFSTSQAYVLEFGDFYVRFFKDGLPLYADDNTTLIELATPWGIESLDFVKIGSFQSADVLYITTGFFPVYKLARLAINQFTLSQVAFDPPATQEDAPTGQDLNSGTLTLSATSGNGVTATVQNDTFLEGDVGRLIVSGAGRLLIGTFVDHKNVTGAVIDTFSTVGPINAIDWHFAGFGSATLNPSTKNKDSGVSVSASLDTFHPTDVGKYIVIYGGLIEIDVFTDSRTIQGVILSDLKDVPNDPTTGLPFNDPPETSVWTIEVRSWSDELGYPTCGCFFQSRMFLCQGQTINGSVTGDFENFAKGSSGDDAIQRTIDDDQVNPIRWIKAVRTLQMGTAGAAYEATASTEGTALSPSDFTVLPVASRGSANIPPIRIGGHLIYVQYGNKKMRELVFDFVTDKFRSPSLLTLAEHLTEYNFINDASLQQEPDSVIWCMRDDGLLLALTYQEDENVIGWSRHPTAGAVTSIAVIPRPLYGVDWLWGSIEREINGVVETYVEHMDEWATVGSREWVSLQTDASLVVTPNSSGVVSGLNHLEGATVRVIADGIKLNDSVVVGGSFTLNPLADTLPAFVEVGLDYQSEGITLEPIIPPQQGGMMVCRRWKNLGLRVRHAGPGLTVNIAESADLVFPLRKPYHLMDRAVPLQEGKLCAEQLDWSPWARVSFKQTLPFPAEVLNIDGELEIADERCCDTVEEIIQIPLPTPDVGTSGVLLKECAHTCPLGQYAQAVYQGGTGPAGPAIRISSTATTAHFRGLAALYIPAQSGIAIVLYQGEALTGIGTVIATYAVHLNVGDVIRIAADLINAESYNLSVIGTVVLSRTIDNISLPIANPCLGFIEVVSVPADTIPTGPPAQEGTLITKDSDEVRSSNTTLADDGALKLPVLANEVWAVRAVVKVATASATPDIKFQFVGPAGSEGFYIEDYNIFGTFDLGTSTFFGMTTTAEFTFDVFIRNGATAGNLSFQWAQNTSSTDTTTVKKDSYMMAIKQ